MLSGEDHNLLQEYINGTLSIEETAHVENRLKTEPSFADGLIRLSREEAVLVEWASSETVVATSVNSSRTSAAPMSSESEGVSARAATFSRSRVSSRWGRILVLAASLFFVLAMLLRPRNVEEVSLAQLEELQGEVFIVTPVGESVPAQRGQKLFTGLGVRTDGENSSVVVRYPDSTRLELAGDSRIQFAGKRNDRKVEVQEGAGDVRGLPEGKEFVLSTPLADVRAKGSSFSFASLPDATRVESEKGTVQVVRKSDGKSVVVESGKYTVASRSIDSMNPLPVPVLQQTFNEGGSPTVVAFSPSGLTLVSGNGRGQVKFWDLQTGETEQQLEKSSRRISSLRYSHDGRHLIAVSEDRYPAIWDALSGKERVLGKSLRVKLTTCTISPDLKTMVAGGEDRLLRFWDLPGIDDRATLKGARYRINALVYSSSGRFLATVGGQDKNGELILWDAAEQRELAVLTGHSKELRIVEFSPDDRFVAAAGKDNRVYIWDTTTKALVQTLNGFSNTITTLSFSPDGMFVATGGGDGLVKLWEVVSGQEKCSFKAHKGNVAHVVFSPDGQALATCGPDKMVKLWDLVRVHRLPL